MKQRLAIFALTLLTGIGRAAQAEGVIGGADEPTQIIVASSVWQRPIFWAAVLLVGVTLYIIWRKRNG